ncbi:MAG: hypothetical protein WCE49_03075, partial [Terrimicrobiaceae bacterium]
MSWLKHRREFPFGIQVFRRRDAEGTGQRSRQIRENVCMQVCRHDSVERAGFECHAGGHRIDEHLVPGDVRKLPRH